MLRVEYAVPPNLGRRGQFRRQRFSGQRDAGHQLFGVAETAAGLRAADPEPVRDDLEHRTAHVGRVLMHQTGKEAMAGYELTTSGRLQTFECAQAGGGVGGGKVQLADRGHGGIERVEGCRYRMHVRNIFGVADGMRCGDGAPRTIVDKGPTVDKVGTL